MNKFKVFDKFENKEYEIELMAKNVNEAKQIVAIAGLKIIKML